MKKSDKNQYDKAWMKYYTGLKRLLIAIDTAIELQDSELTIDEINQIAQRIEKMTGTIERIAESHQLHIKEDKV